MQKAQHRQNQSHSLLGSRIFACENIAFGELRLRSLTIASKLALYSLARIFLVRRSLVGNFPRAFSAYVACDFDSAVVFLKVTKKLSPLQSKGDERPSAS